MSVSSSTTIPPLRSLLFCPATSERAMRKLPDIGADAVAIDLEDAVADDLKESARADVRAALDRFASVRTYVRINNVRSGRTEGDILGIVHPNLDGVVLPKVEGADEVRAADEWLAQAEREQGVEVGSTKMLLLIETGAGIHYAVESLKASPRVETAIFGFVDFMLDVGIDLIDHSPGAEELAYARSAVVVAARTAELRRPLDGPFINVENKDAFLEQCRQARRFGFAGKMLIHPSQVPLSHEGFRPTAEEVRQAQNIIDAFAKAESEGLAAIVVDGRLVDIPVVVRAERIVEAGTAP